MSMFGTGMASGGPRGLVQSFGEEEQGRINGRTILRLTRFIRPFAGKLGLALLLMFFGTGGTLLVPWLTRVIIDFAIIPADTQKLILLGIILLAAQGVTFAATMWQRFILSAVGNRILSNLRNALFAHLQKLSVVYHDRHIIGITISRVMQDVSIINNLLSEGLVTLAGDIFLIAGTIVIMTAMNWQLALLSFAVLPLMVLATFLFSRKARGAYRETREKIGAVIGDLAENIGGMKVTQAFGQEEAIQTRFEEKNRENREANVRAMSLSFVFLPSVDFLSVLAACILLAGGGVLISRGESSIGIVVAFLSYVNRLFIPIRELSQLFTTLQSASAGGERVFELLDTQPGVTEPENPIKLNSIQGDILFENLHFAYTGDKQVLKGVSFHAPAGSTIAIVGETGAGKTTVSSLICRFYEYREGRILLDGHELRSIAPESLHAAIGYISQDPFLFSSSVAENIRFGRPDASQDEVEAAAKIARMHAVISRLPKGYETRVEEGGANFSVGQRQLLCIARAVLVNPSILIMDEATSGVDTITEALIQEALDAVISGRTAVIVAHRLATVRRADQILVLDQGRIAERGTHEELLAAGGMYRGLYEKQFIAV